MVVIKKDGTEEVLIGRNLLFLAIAAIAFLMATSTLLEFRDWTVIEDPADVFGVAFLVFWILLVYGMSLLGFITFIKKITITSDGISVKALFINKEIRWPEVADYGIFYGGYSRGEGNSFTLYFSTEILETKRNKKKKLNRRVIRLDVFERDMHQIKNILLPFCRNYSIVEPFEVIGKNEE